jgi:hypothetical protein
MRQYHGPDGGILQGPAQSQIEERVLAGGVEIDGAGSHPGFPGDLSDSSCGKAIADEYRGRGIRDNV